MTPRTSHRRVTLPTEAHAQLMPLLWLIRPRSGREGADAASGHVWVSCASQGVRRRLLARSKVCGLRPRVTRPMRRQVVEHALIVGAAA